MANPLILQNMQSPISSLLHTLGLTREDLVLHTEQMRAYLSQDSGSQSSIPPPSNSRTLRRSHTVSSFSTVKRNTSPTPPRTPVKAEPVEPSLSSRPMDTMEMVMERKSKQAKRERRESQSRSRDDRRVSTAQNLTPSRSTTPQVPPGTPHHFKYYSERVMGEASTSQFPIEVAANATPETPRKQIRSAAFKVPNSRAPKTPVNHHILSQPSSSHSATPQSSPARIVNIVSSPGPMRNSPDSEEDELDDLPYTLPPGPYSKVKPDFSYAALIGQAILSSPEHRLTLQDIYEWITTVYPFYTRGEQTWMNSIRHSLSTMAVFRKITRGRNEGKSLWAIWDCDIPCFANGNFRKTLCADMVKAKPPPAKSGPKRKTTMEDALTRETKKRRKAIAKEEPDTRTSFFPSSTQFAPVLPPFHAPMYQNVHQQPYYQPYSRPLPTVSAESLFPPLPATSAYHRAMSMSRPSSTSLSRAGSVESGPPDTASSIARTVSPEPTRVPSPKPGLSSSSSLPELTSSSDSTSSPPLPSLDSSSAMLEAALQETADPTVFDSEDEVDKLTAQWLASPSTLDALESGAAFRNARMRSGYRDITPSKDPTRPKGFPFSVSASQESPTTERRLAKGKARMRSPSPSLMYPTPETADFPPPKTPPARPCTPPRKLSSSASKTVQLSPQRTPLSHRGLHMSPSPSLAHYKSNLDPPPAAVFLPQAPLLSGFAHPEDPSLTLPNPDSLRTPSKKRTTPIKGGSGMKGADFSPFASQRLMFGSDSPFRTPSSAIVDPCNPSVLLEQEVMRYDSQDPLHDSPGGSLFGKRSILYDSPGSPSRWDKLW